MDEDGKLILMLLRMRWTEKEMKSVESSCVYNCPSILRKDVLAEMMGRALEKIFAWRREVLLELVVA